METTAEPGTGIPLTATALFAADRRFSEWEPEKSKDTPHKTRNFGHLLRKQTFVTQEEWAHRQQEAGISKPTNIE